MNNVYFIFNVYIIIITNYKKKCKYRKIGNTSTDVYAFNEQ